MMKKLGWIFAALLFVVMLAGLYFNQYDKRNGTEETVFLFDTICTVKAYGENSKEAVGKAVDRLTEIHKKTDVFSKDSEVTKINSADGGEAIEVSDDVIKIILVALEIEEKSSGAFDISVAPLVDLWDFHGEGRIPSAEELEKAKGIVDESEILLVGNRVIKQKSETKIDLGGVAKGYAGDVAIEVMKESGVSGAILDLGGNITFFGTNPESENGSWRVGVQKPFAPTGEYEEIIEKEEGAVVTSGTYQRYFEKDGEKYHHIIDPKTGYPVKHDYSSVTIVSDSALVADCLSTACFVLGEEAGKTLADCLGAEVMFR